jgi:2-hydroxy-3-oxopropionate reductase
MVGGSAAAFERALPVLQAEGKTIVRVGDSGAGQVTKACNQIIIAATNAIISEALVFAAKAGVDPATVRKVLMPGTSQSRILEMSGQRILDGNFQAGFKMRLHYKDLGIALETGRQNGCPMPTTSLVHELYAALVAAGKGDLDFSALSMLFEQLAATQIKRSI